MERLREPSQWGCRSTGGRRAGSAAIGVRFPSAPPPGFTCAKCRYGHLSRTTRGSGGLLDVRFRQRQGRSSRRDHVLLRTARHPHDDVQRIVSTSLSRKRCSNEGLRFGGRFCPPRALARALVTGLSDGSGPSLARMCTRVRLPTGPQQSRGMGRHPEQPRLRSLGRWGTAGRVAHW